MTGVWQRRIVIGFWISSRGCLRSRVAGFRTLCIMLAYFVRRDAQNKKARGLFLTVRPSDGISLHRTAVPTGKVALRRPAICDNRTPMPSKQCELGWSKFGDNTGTIRGDMRYFLVSIDVRRHRLISTDYI